MSNSPQVKTDSVQANEYSPMPGIDINYVTGDKIFVGAKLSLDDKYECRKRFRFSRRPLTLIAIPNLIYSDNSAINL